MSTDLASPEPTMTPEQVARAQMVRERYTVDPHPDCQRHDHASPEQDKSDSLPAPLTSKYAKLSFSDIELLIRMHHDGRTQVEIANVLQCAQSTVSETLAKLKATPDTVRALLKADASGVIANWRRAARVASKRGDHRPAREWLEAAHPELRPQPATSGHGGGVTVIVGTPGAPVRLPDITVSVGPSPLQLEAKSETDSNR
jgi:hypothetical protein